MVPHHYFDSSANIRTYLNWLRAEVGVRSDSEFTISHFESNHGLSLLRKFGNSVPKVIAAASIGIGSETDHPNLGSQKKPNNYWKSMENQLAFLDDLASKLGFLEGDYERWYGVTGEKLKENGGVSLFNLYSCSMYELMSNVYPEYDWLPWKFPNTRKLLWKDMEALRKAVNYVEKSLGFKTREDWY